MDIIPVPPEKAEVGRRVDWRYFSGGVLASLLLHSLALAALIGAVHWPLAESKQKPIEVTLVAPEEEKAQAPEAKAPEEPKTEEAKPEKPAPPPPPPPPEPEQKQKPPEEPPAPPEEQPSETPQNLPVLKPVMEFGKTDTGADATSDGETAQKPEAPEDPKPDQEDAAQPDPAETTDETKPGTPDAPEDTQADTPVEPETQPEPEPQLSPVEEAKPEDTAPEAPVEAADATAEDFGTVGPIVTSAAPAPKPAAVAARSRQQTAARRQGKPGNSPPLAQARELFSDQILGDVRTQTAMAGMPAGQRLNLLCMTELRAQLKNFDPSRPPDMLPSFRPREGKVLEPARAAYHSRGEWYDLAFRCEADDAVTKVRKFSFRIGPPIPRSQWGERGFPSF